MTASYFSFRVQKIVEYIKNVGFLLETDEVKDLGVQVVLREEYGICVPLTKEEASLLQQEMLALAEWNEIREAGLKLWEIHPIDSGVIHCRQTAHFGFQRVTSYPVHYSYPVDQNLLLIGCGEGKPLQGNKGFWHADLNIRVNWGD